MNAAQPINVLGYTSNNKQFVVKTLNTDLRINQNTQYPELEGPNPYEYILAGFAGCINALGQIVAQEQGITLRSLQIEITGNLNQQDGVNTAKPGFSRIEIKLKPQAAVPLAVLKNWLDEVQQRSPAYHTLVNNTPVDLLLFKEFAYN
ncbi:OsmC family protein [Flavobacterium litorale]|uniref:OsmC family protein n=1 Tax=Flavobacterium litorale TaxID=2856519 RepID=A0ABX8V2P7_9FLAO|nr:OsmC family protein [Flavobacterium litorale]QYJ67143.1 OsmC family protein [Flavobacterium litorale]